MDQGTIAVLIVLIAAVALVAVATIWIIARRDRVVQQIRAEALEQRQRDEEQLRQLGTRLQRMESQLGEALALLKSVG